MGLKHLLTPINVYEDAKRRYHAWGVLGYKEVDEEVLPMLKTLALIPGIAPTWSCASHPELGEKRFYLTMACVDENAFDCITYLFDLIRTELVNEGNGALSSRVQLIFSSLLWMFHCGTLTTKLYSFVTIEFHASNLNTKRAFFKPMRQATRNFTHHG
jgi:hypothetical protein